jgi:hypothetical protein
MLAVQVITKAFEYSIADFHCIQEALFAARKSEITGNILSLLKKILNFVRSHYS